MLKRIARVLRYTQVTALLLVGSLGAVLVKTAADFERVDELVDHSHEMLIQLDQVRAGALRSGIALRNFVIAPQAGQLDQARSGAAAAKAAAARVQELVVDNPLQLAQAQEMAAEAAEAAGWLFSSVVIGERDGRDALNSILVRRVNAEGGRRLRETLDALEAEERRLLSERRERRHQELKQIKRLALGAGVIFGIFVLWTISHSSKLVRTGEAAFHELRARALRDPLTDLLNRRGLSKRIDALAGDALTVMAFDLDRFKAVNDSFGHAAGDEVLREVAVRLKQECRDDDLLARVGGDEFLVALPNIDNFDNASRIADRISFALSRPIQLGAAEVSVSASIGIAILGRDGADFAALTKVADMRSYEAKSAGRRAAAKAGFENVR